jgi:hypothetical protein
MLKQLHIFFGRDNMPSKEKLTQEIIHPKID